MYLVDTNVLSELARPQPNPAVLAWLATVDSLNVSVITVEELHFGLSWRPNPRIEKWLESLLEVCNILAVTPEIARAAGQLRGQLQAQGKPRTQSDLLIAATALQHGYVLATRNTRDFQECGVSLLNPFEGTPAAK